VLGERPNDLQPALERGHEVRVAGVAALGQVVADNFVRLSNSYSIIALDPAEVGAYRFISFGGWPAPTITRDSGRTRS
jgi:hypothetical protein